MVRDNFKTNGTEGRFFYVSSMNASDIIREIINPLNEDKNKHDGVKTRDNESEEIVFDMLKLWTDLARTSNKTKKKYVKIADDFKF